MINGSNEHKVRAAKQPYHMVGTLRKPYNSKLLHYSGENQ
tara:strand:+ start:376 stop:495 length:120 start_codon:yes stop_codon:yes gene_type:complete